MLLSNELCAEDGSLLLEEESFKLMLCENGRERLFEKGDLLE
jgi:hypothetical protein